MGTCAYKLLVSLGIPKILGEGQGMETLKSRLKSPARNWSIAWQIALGVPTESR